MNDRMYYSHQAQQRAQRERLTVAAFALFAGASVSALLVLIFAPKRGEETRHELGKQVGQVTHDLRENADRLRGVVEERLDSARH